MAPATRFDGIHEHQAHVANLVGKYKRLFGEEYAAVAAYLKERRKGLKTQFAELEAPSRGLRRNEALERGLYEIPERLEAMLNKHLPMESAMWLRTKEGGRWFAKEFKEFRSGDKD